MIPILIVIQSRIHKIFTSSTFSSKFYLALGTSPIQNKYSPKKMVHNRNLSNIQSKSKQPKKPSPRRHLWLFHSEFSTIRDELSPFFRRDLLRRYHGSQSSLYMVLSPHFSNVLRWAWLSWKLPTISTIKQVGAIQREELIESPTVVEHIEPP